MKANSGASLVNSTIDIVESTNPYFSGLIINNDTGKSLEFCELVKIDKYPTVWMKIFSDELGRLVQGILEKLVTDTIRFIRRSAVPKERTVTYGHIYVNYHPQKKDPNCTRLTVGGDHIHYPWDVRTPTYDLSTSKILFNSAIFTPGAIFITM